MTLRVGLNLPRLLVNGLYTLNGNIFVLDVKGSGPFFSVLGEFRFKMCVLYESKKCVKMTRTHFVSRFIYF